MQGGTWEPEVTQDSMDSYVLLEEISNSKAQLKNNNKEILNNKQQKKRVKQTLNRHVKEIADVIKENIEGKKQEKLSTTKYIDKAFTKEIFQRTDN